ncbi:hypothetical protein [Acidisoma sp. L85]|uniref:hypothetical protein n=1 Tax=Acidisoma sp. L85 TaxID=1641850 RepID=UPI00131CC7F3|nr:hypothetical protein [Acidisoma sp. L85]
MEHDSGWFAHEIMLITHPIDGHRRRLTLPCRWIEFVQNWDAKGNKRPFFQISAKNTAGLNEEKWHILAFQDGSGNQHQYVISDIKETKPNVIRLTKAA